ncbi:MAG: hypothetical protein ACOCV9_08670 [Marinilabiliaceae bacterium]
MSKVTFTEVRSEALDAIKLLKEGRMDVKTAQEVRGLLGTIIDTAKTEVDFIKSIPDDVKKQMSDTQFRSIAPTVEDKETAVEESVRKIEKSRNHYFPGEK